MTTFLPFLQKKNLYMEEARQKISIGKANKLQTPAYCQTHFATPTVNFERDFTDEISDIISHFAL